MLTAEQKVAPIPRFETVTEQLAVSRGMKCLTGGFGVRRREQAWLLKEVIASLGETPHLLVLKEIPGRGRMVFVWK